MQPRQEQNTNKSTERTKSINISFTLYIEDGGDKPIGQEYKLSPPNQPPKVEFKSFR